MSSRNTPAAPYGGPRRDWLKAKVSETGAFVIAGYIEREAIAVAEWRDGVLTPAGLVKFGLAGKELRSRLDPLRVGSASRGGGSGAPRAGRRG